MNRRHLGTVHESIRAEYQRPWTPPAVELPRGRVLRAHLWRWAEFTGRELVVERARWRGFTIAFCAVLTAACVWAAMS